MFIYSFLFLNSIFVYQCALNLKVEYVKAHLKRLLTFDGDHEMNSDRKVRDLKFICCTILDLRSRMSFYAYVRLGSLQPLVQTLILT